MNPMPALTISKTRYTYELKEKMMSKPIQGSWFEFQHPNEPEAKYYNTTLARFTAEDWDLKVKEAAELGMEYLVHMCIAMYFKAFYRTDLLPLFEIGCDDPMEAILSAGDKYGVKFFLTNDYFDDSGNHGRNIHDTETWRKRFQCMDDMVERYGHHTSFYGWYWPIEAYLKDGFNPAYHEYVNICSKRGRALRPEAKILIAPYGTGVVVPDDHYVKALDTLDVDIVAYQDEIGCLRHTIDDLPGIWAGLRAAHDRIQRISLWADIEIFEFEGAVGTSALLPAPFSRVIKQLNAAAEFVDTILIYQFQGMMNKPGSPVFAGHPDSARLYTEYTEWLQTRHPEVLSVKL
jgi:hypothetical protein